MRSCRQLSNGVSGGLCCPSAGVQLGFSVSCSPAGAGDAKPKPIPQALVWYILSIASLTALKVARGSSARVLPLPGLAFASVILHLCL